MKTPIRRIGGYSQNSSSIRQLLTNFHIDVPLFLLIITILGLGLFVLYSASAENTVKLWRQIAWIFFGLVSMWVTAMVPPSILKRWAPMIFVISLVLLLIVLSPIGITVNHAQRWIGFDSLRVQPSEFLKIVLPLTLAWLLSEARIPLRIGPYLLALMVIALPVGLVAIEPDLGTALLILMSGFIVIFLAGLHWKFIAVSILFLIGGGFLYYEFAMPDYQKLRIETLFDGGKEKKQQKGTHWQSNQSKIAIGSGGVYGKGYRSGTQSHHGFLPEADTDFIFAVISEEFGLTGALFLLMLYLLVLFRGLLIATSAQDTFSRLLAGTISLMFMVHVVINMLMVSGKIPVVGLPLSLISRGGTALITTMVGIGILMSIQTNRKLV